jgi:hypothetical protein
MTEAEWLECEDVRELLDYLVGRASSRKFRLFGTACCRRIWPLLVDERSRNAVSVAERYADGLAAKEEFDAARTQMAACRDEAALHPGSPAADGWALAAAEAVLFDAPFWNGGSPIRRGLTAAWTAGWAKAAAVRAADAALRAAGEGGPEPAIRGQPPLLRDIFQNPYRPGWVDPPWLLWNSEAVVKMAQAAYEERSLPSGHLDHARLAILADALEDAGCPVKVILDHLRGLDPHVRGCWVVDLLLGKS